MKLTIDELNLVRQWFNGVDDLHSAYLIDNDRRLYRKIINYLKPPPNQSLNSDPHPASGTRVG